MENFSHRSYWFKVFVAYNATNQTTTTFLHNLHLSEYEFIQARFDEVVLHPLSIHPMFVPVLVMELLFHEALAQVRFVFEDSVRLRHKAGLVKDETYKHLEQENLDIEEEATTALSHEQKIVTLLEKMEFAIKVGNKLMAWLKDFDTSTMTDELAEKFHTAGQIIYNRLEYIVDGLDIQLIRVNRAQSLTRLNRLGVCTFDL